MTIFGSMASFNGIFGGIGGGANREGKAWVAFVDKGEDLEDPSWFLEAEESTNSDLFTDTSLMESMVSTLCLLSSLSCVDRGMTQSDKSSIKDV